LYGHTEKPKKRKKGPRREVDDRSAKKRKEEQHEGKEGRGGDTIITGQIPVRKFEGGEKCSQRKKRNEEGKYACAVHPQ